MAKHITKSVIEDIAYEIKRIGIITRAYETNTQTQEMLDNFGDAEEFGMKGSDTLDWVVGSLEEVFATHDPSFEPDRFRRQAAYKIDI